MMNGMWAWMRAYAHSGTRPASAATAAEQKAEAAEAQLNEMTQRMAVSEQQLHEAEAERAALKEQLCTLKASMDEAEAAKASLAETEDALDRQLAPRSPFGSTP